MANLNLEDLLDRFENGELRYGRDEVFKNAIDSLKLGVGVYAVLDHTLKEINRLNEILNYHDENNKKAS
jgi:hypothetical protein